ncbi:hypothetical protein CSUI_002662 [Cystoisospora suis]|uniref:Uncharacterized protein n=1 Tax=Cystoisospora suis TaxID=483139 RepID=A0A2C6L8B5_9APIC|nr:hypothetical protein CSUI_002662 [Cystoisospora suis]
MKKALVSAEILGSTQKQRKKKKQPETTGFSDKSGSPSASSGEDTAASPRDAIQSDQEKKRREAERRLRAMCAAFWGDDEDTFPYARKTEEHKKPEDFSEVSESYDPVAEATKEGSVSSLGKNPMKKKRQKVEMGISELSTTSAADGKPSPSVTTAHSKNVCVPSTSPSLSSRPHEAACMRSPSDARRLATPSPVGFKGSFHIEGAQAEKQRALSVQELDDPVAHPGRPKSIGERDVLGRRIKSPRQARLSHIRDEAEADSPGKGLALRKKGEKGSSTLDEAQAKAKMLFDETVRDIRKLVYPHLGTFQQRQYFSTALRALGTTQPKGQRMPLPELRSRQASTQKKIAKRIEEEKRLGVSTHVDRIGNLQAGERRKKQQREDRRRRHRFRDILANAGQVDKRLIGKLGLKKPS